ncbi:MAG: single-stranded DNA-binding protein [Candidatus Nitrospinota bacterium M3_3B_026]
MFNRVIIAGNLTRDPEFWESVSGTSVTRLPVACNVGLKRPDGETIIETLFINSVVFGPQAETCRQYLAKGSPVLVEGRLRERVWERDGQKGKKMEIIASRVKFLPHRRDTETEAEASAEPDGVETSPEPSADEDVEEPVDTGE